MTTMNIPYLIGQCKYFYTTGEKDLHNIAIYMDNLIETGELNLTSEQMEDCDKTKAHLLIEVVKATYRTCLREFYTYNYYKFGCLNCDEEQAFVGGFNFTQDDYNCLVNNCLNKYPDLKNGILKDLKDNSIASIIEGSFYDIAFGIHFMNTSQLIECFNLQTNRNKKMNFMESSNDIITVMFDKGIYTEITDKPFTSFVRKNDLEYVFESCSARLSKIKRALYFEEYYSREHKQYILDMKSYFKSILFDNADILELQPLVSLLENLTEDEILGVVHLYGKYPNSRANIIFSKALK